MNVLEELKKIDPNFEIDILGMGYGVKTEDGSFVRIKPFWISMKEIEENIIL